MDRRRLLGAVLLAPPLLAAARVAAQGEGEASPDQGAMDEVAARYAALTSYADTGHVTTSYQWPGTPALVEHHRFETAFRAPRHFFFRFDEDPAAGGDAYVIWCDGGPFQSWWKATGVHEVYDGGRGAGAFINGQSTTKGASGLLPPLLFANALPYGLVRRLLDIRAAGEETIDGRPCRLIAAAGRETGIRTREERPVTIWVDGSDGLIRQVQIGETADVPAGMVDRSTFAITPVAAPELPDSRFAFAPP